MQPLPETAQAIDELDPFAADEGLLEQLVDSGSRVRVLVPACVGLSFSLLSQHVTFTLVATAEEVQALTASVAASTATAGAIDGHRGGVADAMDEEGWRLLADETAAQGISSTLSLPILVGGVVTGGFTLYGATPDCFEGHHDDLAGILGAWAEGAVTNADLPFQTRTAAVQAPRLLRDAASTDVAVGLLAGWLSLDVEVARDRLAKAVVRSELEPQVVARLLIELLAGPHDS